jgi:hypothetical protein
MRYIVALLALILTVQSSGQTTQPAGSSPVTEPAAPLPDLLREDEILPAEQMLDQMLRSPSLSGSRPLLPVPDVPSEDRTTGRSAVAPGAPTLPVVREGTFVIDRVGRLTRAADGHGWELTFDSDGRSMQDPPMVLLPNLKLMQMEEAVKTASRDLRFRVTGMVTEYRGRNYMLLEKVVIVPDSQQKF